MTRNRLVGFEPHGAGDDDRSRPVKIWTQGDLVAYGRKKPGKEWLTTFSVDTPAQAEKLLELSLPSHSEGRWRNPAPAGLPVQARSYTLGNQLRGKFKQLESADRL